MSNSSSSVNTCLKSSSSVSSLENNSNANNLFVPYDSLSSCVSLFSLCTNSCSHENKKNANKFFFEDANNFYTKQIKKINQSPNLSFIKNNSSLSGFPLPFLYPLPPPMLPCSYEAPASKGDELITLILQLFHSLFRCGCLEEEGVRTLQSLEKILYDHHLQPLNSRLSELVRWVDYLFTPLPLAKAFEIYNNKYKITKRLYVPPTFQEVRHILNIAQILGIGDNLKLLTFDGDETLYPDGQKFSNIHIAEAICKLLKQNVYVAVVTAAGYGKNCERYEERLDALLVYLRKSEIQPSIRENFFVFGGESNYLFRCNCDGYLEYVEEQLWEIYRSKDLQIEEDEKSKRNYSHLLDTAENAMKKIIEDLQLKKTQIIRKERAVGLVPIRNDDGTFVFKKENMNEAVHRINKAIAEADFRLAYCVFNGGQDVWVDAGNKAEGLTILQKILKIKPNECIHIGDQFQAYGNDKPTRLCSPTLWICNPLETQAVLKSLFKQIEIKKNFIQKQRSIENIKYQIGKKNISLNFLDEVCHNDKEQEAKLNEYLYCNLNVVDWRDLEKDS